MTRGEVYVCASQEQSRERMQYKRGQRKSGYADGRFHLNSSTVANGSADHGRKRLMVNFVGCPGFTSTCR